MLKEFDNNKTSLLLESNSFLIEDRRPKPTVEELLERIKELEKKVSKG